MAAKKSITITYSILFLVLLAACVFLALQVRFYINDKTDPVAGYADRIIDTEVMQEDIERVLAQDRAVTLMRFSRTEAFAPIATPKPIPTPTPVPPPPPTPVVVGRGWSVKLVMNDQWALLRDYTGKTHTVRMGEEVSNSVSGEDLGFKVIEINKMNNWVKVQDKQGNTDIIVFDASSRPVAPANAPAANPGQPPRGRLKTPGN
jgi:hypothetical protein